MDWKWWLPFIANLITLYFGYKQLQLMRPQLPSKRSVPNTASYWPTIVMITVMIGVWVPYIFDVRSLLYDSSMGMKKTEQEWKAWDSQKLEDVVGKTFRNEKVLLDGKWFKQCTFINVTFEYNGTAPFGLSHNEIVHSRNFTTQNWALNQQVIFFKAMRLFVDDFKIFEKESRTSIEID